MFDRIGLFVDGADLEHIRAYAGDTRVSGFTTNPTLMRKAGVVDYRAFALEALNIIGSKPISFEVFTDDVGEMVNQAELIASWGDNVFVKIPVTNTKGESTEPAIAHLSKNGIKLNVTAIMTLEQVRVVSAALDARTPSVVSVFAGRIADAGVDPVPIMAAAKSALQMRPNASLLWASPREILNLVQAIDCGCDVITMTPDLWAKIPNLGKDLADFSLETVRMFHSDATHAGYSL